MHYTQTEKPCGERTTKRRHTHTSQVKGWIFVGFVYEGEKRYIRAGDLHEACAFIFSTRKIFPHLHERGRRGARCVDSSITTNTTNPKKKRQRATEKCVLCHIEPPTRRSHVNAKWNTSLMVLYMYYAAMYSIENAAKRNAGTRWRRRRQEELTTGITTHVSRLRKCNLRLCTIHIPPSHQVCYFVSIYIYIRVYYMNTQSFGSPHILFLRCVFSLLPSAPCSATHARRGLLLGIFLFLCISNIYRLWCAPPPHIHPRISRSSR